MKNGFFVAVLTMSLWCVGGCKDMQSPFARPVQKKQPVASQPEPPAQKQTEPETEEPAVAQTDGESQPAADGSTADAVRKFIQDLEHANSTDEQDQATLAETPHTANETHASLPPSVRANESLEIPPTSGNPNPAEPEQKIPEVLAVSLTGDTTLETETEAAPSLGIHQGIDSADTSRRVSLAQLIEQAKSDLEKNPADARKQWQLSLLQLAAGQPAKAAELSNALSPEARILTSHIVKTATNASRLLADPLSGTDETLASVDAFRASLREDAELLVPVVALCARVTTFGVYEELPPNALLPYQANRAIVYCEVDNFTVEETGEETGDDGYHALLATRIELFTDSGKSVWIHEEERIEDISRQRREDFFLAQLVTFPSDLGPGDYVLKVAVTDVLSSKTNEGVRRFHIGGIGATTSATP